MREFIQLTGNYMVLVDVKAAITFSRPLRQHFIPDLDQFKYEIEDGYVPEGYGVRYGHDERLFPAFSWKGYAIMSRLQVSIVSFMCRITKQHYLLYC